eukprot:1286646-Prymnesium_polylepis.1
MSKLIVMKRVGTRDQLPKEIMATHAKCSVRGGELWERRLVVVRRARVVRVQLLLVGLEGVGGAASTW